MPGRERVPSFQLPSGTTAERDGSYNLTTVGSIFYNTDTNNVEIRHEDPSNSLDWRDLLINKEQIDLSGEIVVKNSLRLPTGTTTERDAHVNIGNIFYNTDTSNVEIYTIDPSSNNKMWDEMAHPVCGAAMTVSNTVSNNTTTFFNSSTPRTRCVFVNSITPEFISYGKNCPTKYARVGNGGGTGLKIQNAGYSELYGQYSGPYFAIWEHLIKIQVDDENDTTIDVRRVSPTNNPSRVASRTMNEAWPPNVRDGSSGEKISRINPFIHMGVSLKKGDSVYLCTDPVVGNGFVYHYSLYFNVKYIGPVAEFST